MKAFLILCISVVACKLSDKFILNNNLFAIALQDELAKTQKGNVIYSGLSIETLLGLTALGAKGNTFEQIKKVLNLPQTKEKFKDLVKSVLEDFDEANNVLSLANKIFIAEGIEVEADFLKTANDLFRSAVETVEFGKTKDAITKINSWVSEKTNGKITDLVKEDQISDITRMVLVSAIYFKGKFQHPFKAEDTKKRDFHLLDDKTIQVETMKLTERFLSYTSSDNNLTVVLLPYEGTKNRAFLNIAFPHDVKNFNKMPEIFKTMAPDGFSKLKKELATVYLPKFKLESNLDLKPVLKNMGITEIFSAPDLSGITKESLKVDSFTQKVVLKVDEEGTEAAVATAAIANARSLPLDRLNPKIYRIDKPFYFAITFDQVVIFSGRVENPSEAH